MTQPTAASFTLTQLTDAINRGSSIAIHEDGTWHERWEITKLFRWLFGWEQNDNITVAKFVKATIKSNEITTDALKRGLAGQQSNENEINNAVNAIIERLKPELNKANETLQQLREKKAQLKQAALENQNSTQAYKSEIKKIKTEINNMRKSDVVKTVNSIAKHQIALANRQKTQAAIYSHHTKEENVNWLERKITDWRKTQFPKMRDTLSQDDETKISNLCRYEEAVEHAREDKRYRDLLFRFIFKNTNGSCPNSVDIAVQFPQIAKQLGKSFLDKRIKRLPHNIGLAFEEKMTHDGQKVEKNVLLLMQKALEPLKDYTRKVSFDDKKNPATPRVVTIADIFEEFQAKKSDRMGDFEYTQDGVTLCYPKSPILDFTKEAWWEDLPVLEQLSKEELEARYELNLQENKPVLCVSASRQEDPLNVENNHAWFLLHVPHPNGTYSSHAIGKYADNYPHGIIETLSYIFKSHIAKISVIDENEFYFHRESCAVPKILTDEQFKKFMDKIKEALTQAKEENLVFQPQGDNCSTWIQETLDYVFGRENMPRLFDMPMLDATARFPMNHIITTLRWLDTNISRQASDIGRIALACIFGAWQSIPVKENEETVEKTLLRYTPWLQGTLSLPARLFFTKDILRDAFTRV